MSKREKDLIHIEKPNLSSNERPEQKKETPIFFGGRFLRDTLNRIKEAFRPRVMAEESSALTDKLKTELFALEKQAIHEGVDFSRCQFQDIFESGLPLEFESFSPYLADYNLATGEIWGDKLTDVDKIGLKVAAMLRQQFPKARMISLYDEYNTDMPTSSNAAGRPFRQIVEESGKFKKDQFNNPIDAPQIVLADQVKENFHSSIKKLLTEQGIIRADDTENKNFLFVSESEKVRDAEILVEKLASKGFIERQGEAIYFVNDNAENPLYKKIPLRTKNGRWLCEALDASSYIKEENLKICHLVILPNYFKPQQDKVWEILRALGIRPDHYHNIFYDEKQKPEKVAQVILTEIDKYKESKV